MANSESGGTSNPHPKGPVRANDSSLAVQHNANVANFEENPAVYNDTPAKKKSYSWNKGETGNAR